MLWQPGGGPPQLRRPRRAAEVEAMLQNTMQKVITFTREVRGEMQKVTWPTWAELKGQTIVVIVAVMIIAGFIGVVDLILSNTIKFLLSQLI